MIKKIKGGVLEHLNNIKLPTLEGGGEPTR